MTAKKAPCVMTPSWMIDNISGQIAKYDQGKLTIKIKTSVEKVNQIACNMVTPYYPLLEKVQQDNTIIIQSEGKLPSCFFASFIIGNKKFYKL